MDAVPTARFLQARITHLSTTIITRLENILAAALTSQPTEPASTSATTPSATLLTPAQTQLQLSAESAALIRAAEDIMVLTRQLKEVWAFGGLDTLSADGRSGGKGAREEDVETVRSGLEAWLKGETNGVKEEQGSKGTNSVMDGD